jgi:murein DD-endopeptidase MepM/ murein hydrolase activator NlpD
MKIILREEQAKKLINNVINEEDSGDTGSLVNFFQKLVGGSDISNTNTTSTDDNQFSPEIPSGTDLMHPLGHKTKISSRFGKRNLAVGSKNHKGIDFSTPSGTKIYAPNDGRVIVAKDTTPNGCGGFVQIDHGNMKTKFCHLRQWVVNSGDMVKKGQLIGYSGGGQSDPYKGTSTGAHLHYEILNSSNIAMNPTSVQNNLA